MTFPDDVDNSNTSRFKSRLKIIMAHLRTNTESIPARVLFLTTMTVISLMSQDGNGLTPYEQLYNNCLSVSVAIYMIFSLVKSLRQICRILHCCLIIRL